MAASVRRSPALLPAALFLCVLSVYLLTGAADLKHNGDTDLRYQMTQALVDRGQIFVDHPWWSDTRMARGTGGHQYAFYGPGQTMLMIPLYIAGKVIAHHLSLPYDITTLYAARSLDLFLGAFLALLMFFFALRLGYSRRVSALLTLIFAFATAAWPDAQSALEQTQVDLFLLFAAYCLLTYLGHDTRRRWLVGAGCAIGAAICTRYDAAIYVALLAAFLFVIRTRSGRRRLGIEEAIVFVVATIPWILALGVWNFARFGSPFLTGLHEQTFGESFIPGFFGLTVSPGKGLIWYVPLVFLLPWAARSFIRQQPIAAALFGMLILAPLLFYSNILYWHGDPAWGPRYLYTMIPYLTLPLGEILSRWHRRAVSLRLATVVLMLLGVGLSVSAVSVTQWRFWYRLEVTLQREGHPFHWGAANYHYYWNVRQTPILIQVDDVYQVARLALGSDTYRYTAKPDPFVSNPADNYPINSLNFWWADTMHPLLGARTRDLLAALLALLALGSALGILVGVLPERARRVAEEPPSAGLTQSESGGGASEPLPTAP